MWLIKLTTIMSVTEWGLKLCHNEQSDKMLKKAVPMMMSSMQPITASKALSAAEELEG